MTVFLLLFLLMCAGWICFFVAEAAYSDAARELRRLEKLSAAQAREIKTLNLERVA